MDVMLDKVYCCIKDYLSEYLRKPDMKYRDLVAEYNEGVELKEAILLDRTSSIYESLTKKYRGNSKALSIIEEWNKEMVYQIMKNTANAKGVLESIVRIYFA